MVERVMQDPPAENIDGEKIVHHRFDHGIDWSVNVSHILIAVAVIAAVLYLRQQLDSDDDEQESQTPPVA